MIIENRVKKEYSEELFLQLCFMSIIYKNYECSINILKQIDQKKNGHCHSIRSYSRYIHELKELELLPYIITKAGKSNTHYYYLHHKDIDFHYKKYLENYINNKFNPSNAHQQRLLRCLVLICNDPYLYYPEEIGDDEDIDKDGFYPISYDYYPTNVNIRTRQRDTKLIKDVLKYTHNI